jgi:hypothetical protein
VNTETRRAFRIAMLQAGATGAVIAGLVTRAFFPSHEVRYVRTGNPPPVELQQELNETTTELKLTKLSYRVCQRAVSQGAADLKSASKYQDWLFDTASGWVRQRSWLPTQSRPITTLLKTSTGRNRIISCGLAGGRSMAG